MMDPPNREIAVFSQVRWLPAAQRAAHLDRECAGDIALRKRIEELLQAIDEAGAFLREPAPGAQRPSPRGTHQAGSDSDPLSGSSPAVEKVGDHIGRYKLLQQIGEGGCGVVYMAEQQQPIRRQVALKVIKLGMDTRSVIARFEAERQALALMDHPNIAKVLDAGATANGRPFFVMELVQGIKITDYCDQHQLPTRKRLELFIQICQAIQHAHQKGVIHRDIKPSNVLVTSNDRVPLPKVIDFGIAKATNDQNLTDKTVFTHFEQFIGTPAYMSPEQAEMDASGIDTRTDIYSLGILLYELLTGQTPFDTKLLLKTGLDEIRRIIRDQEPPRPSTRLSSMLAGELTLAARHRQSEAPALIRSVRGDLDWIVMKALEKERARRYETANGLAMDVRRHLTDQPVVARPPSRLYEFQKTVRRHKLGFFAAGAVTLALLLGFVTSSIQAARATRAEHEQARSRQEALVIGRKAEEEAAKSRQAAQFLSDMLQGIIPSVASGQSTPVLRGILSETARRVSLDFRDQPEIEAELATTIGQVYDELGDAREAEAMFTRALELRRKSLGPEHPSVALTLDNLARFFMAHRDVHRAEVTANEALAIQRKQLDREPSLVAHSLDTLASVLWQKGDPAGAEANFRQALAIRRKWAPAEDAGLAETLSGLMDVLLWQHKYAETELLFEDVWPVQAGVRPESSRMLRVRGIARARTGHWRAAADDFSKVIELEPGNHENYHFLAPLLVQAGDLVAYRALCAEIRARFGDNSSDPKLADRMAKDCLILECPGCDLTIEARLADVAATLGQGYEMEPWAQLCKGLAEYRQGRYASALTWVGKALGPGEKGTRRDVECYMVMAMAQHHLMQIEQARLSLAKGIRILEAKVPLLEGGDLGDGWVDWLIAHALMREARALIETSAPPRAAD